LISLFLPFTLTTTLTNLSTPLGFFLSQVNFTIGIFGTLVVFEILGILILGKDLLIVLGFIILVGAILEGAFTGALTLDSGLFIFLVFALVGILLISFRNSLTLATVLTGTFIFAFLDVSLKTLFVVLRRVGVKSKALPFLGVSNLLRLTNSLIKVLFRVELILDFLIASICEFICFLILANLCLSLLTSTGFILSFIDLDYLFTNFNFYNCFTSCRKIKAHPTNSR